jgi:hypothetical protein
MTLALGVPPDWTGAPSADEEWRIAWAKFYFGLDPPLPSERRALPADLGALDSWIEQVQVGSESTDTVARRLLNRVYA